MRDLLAHSALKTQSADLFRPLYDRFVAASLFLLAIGLVTAYVLGAYLGVENLDERFLYFANDPGGLAPGYVSETVIGVHRFGDLATTLSWSNLVNPLSPNLEFPSTYGPLMTSLIKPLLWVPYPVAVFLWLLVSAIGICAVIWYAMGSMNFVQKVTLLITSVILTRPFLLMLDRGNVQSVVFILMALAALLIIQKRQLWIAECAIILAASMKFYPIVLVVLFLAEGNTKRFLRTVMFSLLALLLSLGIISGGNLLEGVQGILKGTSLQSSYFSSGASAGAWSVRLLEGFGVQLSEEIWTGIAKGTSFLVGAVLLIAIYVGMRKKWLDSVQGVVLTFGTMSLAVPVSWGYNLVWASLAAVLLITRSGWRLNQPQIMSTATIIGFIPLICLFPWVTEAGTSVNTGVAEFWAFPFLSLLTVVWLWNGTRSKPQLIA